jgi:DNA-directed RNA polymerase subunit RPC12/RpoP
MIRFKCKCENDIKIEDELGGRLGKCPHCGNVITAPRNAPEAHLTPEPNKYECPYDGCGHTVTVPFGHACRIMTCRCGKRFKIPVVPQPDPDEGVHQDDPNPPAEEVSTSDTVAENEGARLDELLGGSPQPPTSQAAAPASDAEATLTEPVFDPDDGDDPNIASADSNPVAVLDSLATIGSGLDAIDMTSDMVPTPKPAPAAKTADTATKPAKDKLQQIEYLGNDPNDVTHEMYRCPHCREIFSLDPEKWGDRNVRCKKCRTQLHVPMRA